MITLISYNVSYFTFLGGTMNKKDFKIDILTSIILFLISIFLISICTRLLIAFIRTFIYLTGLTVILIGVMFCLGIIYFFIHSILKRLKCYKRNTITKYEILDITLKIQTKIVFILTAISILLYLLNLVNF